MPPPPKKRTRNKPRNDTSSEVSSVKRTEERYRELKKRYMKVCRDNARLRRELNKYISLEPLDIGEDLSAVEAVDIPLCTQCGKGELKEIKLPKFTLSICQSCGHKTKIQLESI